MQWVVCGVIAVVVFVGFSIALDEKTKQKRKNGIVGFAVALLIASIVYCPHRIRVDAISVDRVEYGVIWDAPEHSSLEFGRLALTWLGIVTAGGAALFMAHNSEN